MLGFQVSGRGSGMWESHLSRPLPGRGSDIWDFYPLRGDRLDGTEQQKKAVKVGTRTVSSKGRKLKAKSRPGRSKSGARPWLT